MTGKSGFRFGIQIAVISAQAMKTPATITNVTLPVVVIVSSTVGTLPRHRAAAVREHAAPSDMPSANRTAPPSRDGATPRLVMSDGMRCASLTPSRAHSSAGERSLHTREVPGSIPGAPITPKALLRPSHDRARAPRPEDCRSSVTRRALESAQVMPDTGGKIPLTRILPAHAPLDDMTFAPKITTRSFRRAPCERGAYRRGAGRHRRYLLLHACSTGRRSRSPRSCPGRCRLSDAEQHRRHARPVPPSSRASTRRALPGRSPSSSVTPATGVRCTAVQLLPAITGPQAVTAQLRSEKPGTTEHFRVVVTTAAGQVVGEDQTFTTVAAIDTARTRHDDVRRAGRLPHDRRRTGASACPLRATARVHVARQAVEGNTANSSEHRPTWPEPSPGRSPASADGRSIPVAVTVDPRRSRTTSPTSTGCTPGRRAAAV